MIKNIFLVFLFISTLISAESHQKQFYTGKGYGVSDGLSHGLINKIMQDKNGFIWLATYHGLNRFDGYSFVPMYANRTDSNAMPDNRVSDLCTDENGDIWIAYSSGDVALYESGTGHFRNFTPRNIRLVNDGMYMYTINTARDGFVNYFFFNSPNLYRYNIHSQQYRVFILPGSEKSGDNIASINLCNDTSLIVLSRRGVLYNFSLRTNTFTALAELQRKTDYFIGKVSFGRYMWGIDTLGVAEGYDLKTGRHILLRYPDGKLMTEVAEIYGSPQDSRHYILVNGEAYTADTLLSSQSFEKIDPALRENKYLLNITEDNAGNLWMGTLGMGVIVLHRKQSVFTTLTSKQGFLNVHSLRSIKTVNGRIVIAGYFGLDIYTPGDKKAQSLYKGENVYSVLPDSDDPDILWFGQEAYHSRLFKYDLRNRKISSYELVRKDGFPHTVYDIKADKSGNLWIALDAFLLKFNKKTGETKTYSYQGGENSKYTITSIRHLFLNAEGNIICSTTGSGVVLFNPRTEKFLSSAVYLGFDLAEIPVLTSYQKDSILWFGTRGRGLYRVNLTTRYYRRLSVEDGLPNNIVYGLIEDKSGDIWLSTNNGLCRISPDNFSVRNFEKQDGLQDNEFNSGAYHINETGTVYFGGIFGLTWFNPLDIAQKRYSIPVHLTRITLLTTGASKDIYSADEKKLTFNSDELPASLRFSGLNFNRTEKNQYAYRIKEVSASWNFLGTGRDILLGNLAGGTYTLEVKAATNDGMWGPESIITIVVVPPFYKTGWFYILAGLLLTAGAALMVFLRIRRVEEQKHLLEELVLLRTKELDSRNIEVTRQKNEVEHLNKELIAANKTKDTFFSIIAHDLRSPVGAMIGYLGILGEDYDTLEDEERKSFIADIRTISLSTMDLLDNLLQWSRMQSGSIIYRPEDIRVAQITDRALSLLRPVSVQKHIEVQASVPAEVVLFTDPNVLFFIIRNLVSNAVKFTPEGGRVTISYERSEKNVYISVRDTGTGITDEALAAIFGTGLHYSTPGTNKEPGTGLGLKISIALAKLSGGTLLAERGKDGGSVFSLKYTL